MKNMKRLLAVLLAVVMCLSCLAGLSFADTPFARETRASAADAKETEKSSGVGFQSLDFQLRNSYKYADDEIVTAIVLLEGAAPAELPEGQRAAAASRVAAQHNTLRNALRAANISYAEEFEYDSLLNGMSISVAYGDLEKIAAIDSVKAVYIANHYAAPVIAPAERMASSNTMTGVADFQKAGYKGEGMVIAVLDTGITPQHEAFQVYGDVLANAALSEEDAKAFIEEKGYGSYLSQKIPFAFDYYDQDDDATDDKSGHGTHVSGIALGYAETDEGEITFCGTAPYAQLVAMKVFSSGSANGTNSGIYFAALEDCYELGVDVINMSLGAQNGNTYDWELEDEVFGNVYKTLQDNGIILSAAAGNEYSQAQYAANWTGGGYVTSDYTDYGVVGTPSTYDGNLSVASVENQEFPGYVLKAGDKEIPYYDSEGTQFYDAVAGMENVEFVVIDGFGTQEDFAGVDVKGKVALISRGDITFQEKVDNAAKAGALAALVYNNADGIIYMSINPYRIPAASITKADGEYLKSIAVMPEDPNPDDTGSFIAVRKLGSDSVTVARKLTDDVKNAYAVSFAAKPGTRAAEDPADVLYSTSFESEADIADWTFVDKDGDGFNWYQHINTGTQDLSATDGNGCIASESYDNDSQTALNPDNWAISPAIDLTGVEEASVTFQALGQDPDWAEEVFAIYAGTSADPEAMTKLTDDFTATGSAVEYGADLSDFAGQTVYVAIRHYNVSDQFILIVDQFEVAKVGYVAPEPPAPPELPENLIAGWYFETEDELSDWTVVDADGDGENWGWYTSDSVNAYEGSGYIASQSYTSSSGALTPDNWAISPAFDLTDAESPVLSLYAKNMGYPDVFAIYAGTSADPEAMVKLGEDITSESAYKQYLADLSDFAGESEVYVAIRHYNCTDQFYLFIDQVEIFDGNVEPVEPTEPKPEDDLGGEAVYGWYFESEDEIADWIVADIDGDGNNWSLNTSAGESAYEGSGIITSASYINGTGAVTPDNWAITPAIDLSEIDDAVLSLFYAGQDPSYAAENFQIYVGEEADPEKMEAVSDETTASGEYQQLAVDLSAYAGKTIYVAIRHFNVTDMFRLNIDMVEVRTGTNYEPPAPVDPVARPVGVIDSFPEEPVILENPDGWLMSDFSSWGATPVLTLKPQISGVGGDVYSASFKTEDGYEIMSGTSMATPNMTGMMALVSEYIDKNLSSASQDLTNPFTDVEEGKFYYDAVLWAVNHDPQITNGTDDTHFSPNGTCTRGQVVTFLWRAYGEPEPTTTEHSFTDLKAGAFYYKAVLWAVEKGVTNGTSDTTFSPNGKCTRGQVVTFLWRAAGEPEPTTTENPFTDVKEDAFYYKAVLWAVENEITNGTSADKFSPSATCTRGQVVTFLYRALYQAGPMSKVERAELAEKFAQSTALILADKYGDPYSPRKQGAGLGSMTLLSAANAYITEPIQNLFDNADGEFEFTFKVKDLYGEGATYTVTPLVQTDYAVQGDLDQNGTPETYNSLSALTLATEPYEYNGTEYPADVEVEAPETVTVPANGEAEVTVKIKLTDETKAYLDEMFPNGSYIEGFILLDAADAEGNINEEIHATYMGFYGDWTKAPILEPYDWRDAVDAINFVSNEVADEEGNTYADLGYSWADAVDFQLNTDLSLAYAISSEYYAQGQLYGGYAGNNMYGYDPEIAYDEAHIAIAPGTGEVDMLYMIPYNVRNVRHLVMVVSDAETGEIYAVDDTEYLPKCYFDAENGYWANTGNFMFDGTDADGEVLPNGTTVNINYYANLMYGDDKIGEIIGEEKDYSKLAEEAKDLLVWSYDCAIDTEAPTVVGEPVIDKDARTITVTAKDDNYVAAIILTDANGSLIDSKLFSEAEAGKEVTATFEYPEGATLAKIYVEDYATNEGSGVAFIEEPTYVTINFSHPEGTELGSLEEEYVAYVGENVTPPTVLGDIEGYTFSDLWTTAELDDTDEDTLILSYMYGMLDLYFSDEAFVVTEDMDGMILYPVYYREEVVEGVTRDEEPLQGFYFEEEPTDWTFVDSDGDGFLWQYINNNNQEDGEKYTAYEGDGLITSASWDSDAGPLNPDNWAISPAIDLTEAEAASVSVWAVGQDPDYCEENFAIYAGESADPAAMTKVSDDFTAEDKYVNYVADLSDFAGKTVYVAVRHYDVSDMFMLNVDKVEVFDSVVEPEVPASSTVYYTTDPLGSETPDPEPATGYVLSTGLKDGDKVVIYNPDSGKALSNADSDASSNPERYRLGVDVTPVDGVIAEPAEGTVWTVEITIDGIAFKDADGKYLSVPANYANLVLDSDCKYWTATESDGLFFLISTESKGTQGDLRGIEYYQGKFTTFYATEANLANSRAAFGMEFYVLSADADETPIVP